MNMAPSEEDLHAYVDGQLDDEARAAVELYLARHPERAQQVRDWMRDARELRAAIAGVPLPRDNPALDPAAIRARRAGRARSWMAMAASLVLCFAIGSVGGWQARGWRATPTVAPMSDAIEAYKLMVVDRSVGVDVAASSLQELQSWLDRSVGMTTTMPDLGQAGFRPVGGRLFATESGAAAMVIYEDEAGRTLSFYVRPPLSAHRLLAAGERAEGGLITRYGSRHGALYAIVGPAEAFALQGVAKALEGRT
ncbi:anti-sigma factor family protein [Bordetella genomosp. 13]|uniref:Anti-sigma factor n=1 Tax=Bordetella genomosp. 13 TaxID=463040 RepID=A0A1W6ZFE4_9BORD|nr:anti-sigma factor [Bordetella genomosp. 13]ARP96123.1 anti-sigma factor [Bordetella genomosp. 13]